MELKQKVISGLKWSILSKFIIQILSWISTFLVIKILTPEDYGVVALATIIFSLINILAVNGFTTALVKNQGESIESADQIFTIALSISIFLSLLSTIFANNIAEYYHNVNIENVLYVMAVVTPLNCFLIVPEARLSIAMNFKKIAFAYSVSALIATVVALTSAYSGMGFWSLVLSRISGLLVKVALLNYLSPGKYALTRKFEGAKNLLVFTAHLQFGALLWYGYNKLDSLIVGKYFGINQLGIYNVSIEIASIPMTKVSNILNQVGFSAFATLKEDPKLTGYYLLKSIKLMALIAFPVFFGISLISFELVSIVLGKKWLEAAPIISIFCFVFPFRMINSLIQSYVNSMNAPKFNVSNTAIIAVILISSILTGIQFGLFMTAVAWVFGFFVAFIIILFRVKKKFSLKFKGVFSWIGPMLVSIIMYILIEIMDNNYAHDINIWYVLISKVIGGFAFISIFYFIFYSEEFTPFLKKLKN